MCLFSHGLAEARLNNIFGQVGVRQISSLAKTGPSSILVLISESDEIVCQPRTAQDLLQRRGKAFGSDGQYAVEKYKYRMCIKDATHGISGEGLPQRRAKVVTFRGAWLRYIDDVVGGVDQTTWDIYRQEEHELTQHEQDSEDADEIP